MGTMGILHVRQELALLRKGRNGGGGLFINLIMDFNDT